MTRLPLPMRPNGIAHLVKADFIEAEFFHLGLHALAESLFVMVNPFI
jgi:hypothetical protein